MLELDADGVTIGFIAIAGTLAGRASGRTAWHVARTGSMSMLRALGRIVRFFLRECE